MEEKKLTGYPSIDKPWLKYYSEEAINAPLPECTIYEYLHENNKENHNCIALDYYGTKITYAQLFSSIKCAASGLYALGIRKGDIVTIFSVNTPELIYCIFGLNLIGAVPMFEYVTESADEARKNMEASHSEYVICLDCFLNEYGSIASSDAVKKVLVLEMAESMPLAKCIIANTQINKTSCCKSVTYRKMVSLGGAYQIAPYSKGNTAVIVHSGGTTGTPKGVCLSNDNINYVAWAFLNNDNDMKKTDTLFSCIPVFHAFGFVMGMIMPLNKGACLILTSQYDEDHFVKTFLSKRPNHSMSSSTYMSAFTENKKIRKMDLAHYSVCGLGGTPMTNTQELNLEKFFAERNSKAKPNIGYGMSELSSAVCTEINRYYGKIGSVGIPLCKSSIKVVDTETLEELPYDVDGELYISSPGLMTKYHMNDAETESVIVTDSAGKRWIKSGDLGHIDEDGFVFITGKIKRIYTTRAHTGGPIFHVFPDYIANVLAKMPQVTECAVVCLPHPQLKSIPIAFVTTDSREHPDDIAKDLIENCALELPVHSVPKRCYIVSSIPKTPIGKIDYRALEQRAAGIEYPLNSQNADSK